MSSATPRRDNGLHATSYDRLADVETHLVDGLLERLRDEGVAAYSAPSGGRPGPYGDTVLPQSPSDSVYVDSGRRDVARSVVDRYLEETAAELAWAGIVADFDLEPAEGDVRWPAAEDVDEDEPGAVRTAGFEELRDTLGPAVLEPLPADPPESREDHFEPPPPPPLPSVDVISRFAWAGALGGPIVLLLAALAGISLAGWVGVLALFGFMAGFVTLVARMKDRPPTDSGPDDGAVV
jgi:hypothetical protein